MSDYYALYYDGDRDDLETVSDYDMGDFDPTVFWSGERFGGDIPPTVRLWVTKGKPSDYLANPISWPIASERFWRIIRPLVEKDCQLVTVPLYYEKTETLVRDYLLMNVTSCLAATRQMTDTDEISNIGLFLDKKRIPSDTHIFRVTESSSLIIVSDIILKEVWGKKLRGLAFIKIPAE